MMGGPRINYTKMDRLIRARVKTLDQIAAEIHCSKSSVVTYAREIGEQRKKTGRPRTPVEPREKSFDYLGALRAGFPEDVRQNEGLSSYMQGGERPFSVKRRNSHEGQSDFEE